MKLRRFDSTNTVQARETKPCVTVSATGVWRANGPLGDLLKLKKGAGVVLLQDEEAPDNWFIGVDKASGFPVHEKDGAFLWTNRVVKDELFTSLETEHPSGRMLVGEEPVKHDGLTLYPVLTSSLVYRKRKPRS